MWVAGRLNKQIAAEFGTVEKTIKVHRGRMMQKFAPFDLVRMTSKLRCKPVLGLTLAAARQATGAGPPQYGLAARANPVAVGIVAAAATVIGPCRSRANGSRANRRRAVAPTISVSAVTVATAAHCDSATPRASNRYRAAAVTSACNSAAAIAATMKSATTTEATTAATASIGRVWDQTGGEQNECCWSSENIAKHD
ncbi:hypothetical protein ABIE49_002538 [Bradyrhizobium sp. OAE829]